MQRNSYNIQDIHTLHFIQIRTSRNRLTQWLMRQGQEQSPQGTERAFLRESAGPGVLTHPAQLRLGSRFNHLPAPSPLPLDCKPLEGRGWRCSPLHPNS